MTRDSMCIVRKEKRTEAGEEAFLEEHGDVCWGEQRGLCGHRCHLEGSPLRTAGSLPGNLLLFSHYFKVFSWQVLLGSHQVCSYSALFTTTFYFIGMQNEDLLPKHRFGRERIYCTNAQRNSIT